MNNCSEHNKEIAGIADMKQLAEMIGDLHYETLAELFDHLERKFYSDSQNDADGGRVRLSAALNRASFNMRWANRNIQSAWNISKAFMIDDTLNK